MTVFGSLFRGGGDELGGGEVVDAALAARRLGAIVAVLLR